MDTNEVVEMIDAITEGKYYAHGFSTNRDTITIEVGTNAENEANEFWFSSFTPGANFLAKIDDPRTAREIAGALVAWANRKEGLAGADERAKAKFNALNVTGAEQCSATDPNQMCDDCRKGFEAHKAEVTAPSTADYIKIQSGRTTREEWYRNNVDRMSQETKDRNLKDLKEIYADHRITKETRDDVQNAIMILKDNGAK